MLELRCSRALPWVSLGCLALAALTYLWLVCTRSGAVLDNEAWGLLPVPRDIASTLELLLRRGLLLVAPVLLLWDVARHRDGARLVVAATSAVSLALGCRWLREHLPRPYDVGFWWNTFPSTHVAVTAGLLVVVALGHSWRCRMAWLCAALVPLCLLGSTVTFAHRPSDVLGGALLAVGVPGLVTWLVSRGQPPSASQCVATVSPRRLGRQDNLG